MKKYMLSFLEIVTGVLLLTSCAFKGRWGVFTDDLHKAANETAKRLVDALNSSDNAQIEALFSKNLRNETDTFSQDVTELLAFIGGKINSFADEEGETSEGEINHGKKREIIESSFSLKTETQEYLIVIRECTKDETDRDNIGIASIWVINALDREKHPKYLGKKRSPGIYIMYSDSVDDLYEQ